MNSKIVFASIAAMLMIFGAVVVFDDSNAEAAKDISKVEFDIDKDQYYLMTTLGTADLKGLSGTYTVNMMKENIIPNHIGNGVYVSEVKNVADLNKDKISIDIVDKDGNHYVYNTYSIIVSDDIENGTVTSDKVVAKAGEAISLTVEAKDGFIIGNVSINGEEIKATEGKYGFTMPAGDVIITAEFKTIPTYSVTIGSTDNGKVTADKTKCGEGTTVTLTVVPEKGFMLGTLQINGTEQIVYTDIGDGKYTFVMPASNVTVTATFTDANPCKVVFDEEAASVSANGKTIRSGDSVSEGTVVTVVATERIGYDATVSPALDNGTYKVTKDVEFKVTYTEKEYSDASFSGDIDTSSKFSAKQLVTVPSDSTILNGSVITIEGKLYVPDGVTLTVSAGAELIINGVADIRGSLVIEAADEDEGISAGAFLVAGEATVAGKLDVGGLIMTSSDGKIVIAAAAEIAGEISGNIEISQDAALTVTGFVSEKKAETTGAESDKTVFTVYGNLTVNSEVPTIGFDVQMKGDGVFSIENVVLGITSKSVGEASGTITVTDDGVFYNDKDDKKLDRSVGNNLMTISGELKVEASEGETSYENASAYGASVSGITVSVSSTVTKVADGDDKDKMKHVSVMSVSGSVTVGEYISYNEVKYDGGKIGPVAVKDTLNASVIVVGAEASTVKIDKDLSFGDSIIASFNNVDVAAPVTFVKELILKNAAINGNVTVPTGATLNVEGTFDVKAVVDASAVDAKDLAKKAVFSANADAKITVSDDGSILTNAQFGTVSELNATMYGKYVYVSFDRAVAALNAGTTKTVSVYGKQVLTASAEIPAVSNAVIMQSGSHLDIGAEDNTDVVLTIASTNGVVLKNSSSNGIEVYGTLYANKMTNVDGSLRNGNISSDVYSCALTPKGAVDANGFAKWTNIYTALSEAESGQTVTLQRNIAGLKTVEIKDGVTLDANGKTVTVAQKATLTVAGTLDLTKDGSKVVLAEPIMEGEKVKTAGGSIAYTGYILFTDSGCIVQEGLVLPGAFYIQADKDVKVLTTYANGAADALKAKDRAVGLIADKDGKIALGEISFVGEKDKIVSIVIIPTENLAISGTVSLSYADFYVLSGSTVDAKFISGTDSIAVKAKVGTSVMCVRNGALGEDVVLMVSGFLADIDDKTETSVVFEGSVFIADDLTSSTDKNTVNGDLVVCGVEDNPATFLVNVLDVAGTATVRNGSSIEVMEQLTVSGAVKVENGGLGAEEAAVSGSIDASAVDEDGNALAGFYVTKLYIGVDSKILVDDATAAAASVIGNVVMDGYALAAPDATVPEAFKDAEKYKSTVFVAEGRDYIVAYIPVTLPENPLTIGEIDYVADDAKFENWENSKGEIMNAEIIGKTDKVTAKITYEIYTVSIYGCEGVENIAIDGNLVNIVNNSVKLKAGQHEVTFSKSNMYGGDGKLSVVSSGEGVNATVSGMNFNVSGSEGTITLQITGISATGYDPQPIIIPGESDDGMSLTDYLLIVLVVLIVIMAVIVAMRLMRS